MDIKPSLRFEVSLEQDHVDFLQDHVDLLREILQAKTAAAVEKGDWDDRHSWLDYVSFWNDKATNEEVVDAALKLSVVDAALNLYCAVVALRLYCEHPTDSRSIQASLRADESLLDLTANLLDEH